MSLDDHRTIKAQPNLQELPSMRARDIHIDTCFWRFAKARRTMHLIKSMGTAKF